MILVFVHINKTAGSTVRYMLRSTFGSRHCDVEPWHAAWKDPPFSADDLGRVRKIYPRLRSIAGHRIAPWIDLGVPLKDLNYFSFFRDPVKTTASRFQYHLEHRRKEAVFEEWIQRDWLRDAQTYRIAGVRDANAAIHVLNDKNVFVGLAEHFDESMIMLKDLRVPELDISYRRMNVAKTNTIARQLLADKRTRELLVDANQQDLDLYRYVASEMFPRQQREYGSSLSWAVGAYRDEDGNGFNKRRLVSYRIKHHAIYKPLLRLYRRPATRQSVARLLG